MEEEIKELKEKLNEMDPSTLGYTLMEIEIREKEMLMESLKKLI